MSRTELIPKILLIPQKAGKLREYYDTYFSLMILFGILRIPPFVNHNGKDVNSDCLVDQWEERSVLGHAQIHKGRMKGDDPEIDTAQTQKRFNGRLALLEKIRKTFTDSIPNKIRVW